MTQAGRYLATSMLKMVPGAGTIAGGTIRAGVASSLTYGVGEAWIVVCTRLLGLGPRATGALESRAIREMFVQALKERSGSSRRQRQITRGRR